MSASSGKENPLAFGWGMPTVAQPGYPVQGGNYPAQPGIYPAQMGYPIQPGYPAPTYPAQPGYAVEQPGFEAPPPHPFGPPPTYTVMSGVQPVYDASARGSVYQPGPGVGPRSPSPKLEDDIPSNLGNSFSDKAIRHAFIRKVYIILSLQLTVTLFCVALFTFHEGLKMFVQKNLWISLLSYGIFIVTYFTLICCGSVRRKWPGNIIMLSVFTLALSYMTGAIASTYDTKIVLFAVGITAIICFLLTMFATQTRFDFTGFGPYLFVAGIVLFIFGIIAIFTYSEIMQTVYSAGIALLFSVYLVFDTQMIVGGRKHQMSAEEHIFGALMLYMDVVMIFLSLLSLSKN